MKTPSPSATLNNPAQHSAHFVIFDIETTGLSPDFDEITQIAAVRIRDGEILHDETFATFVKTENPISKFITNLTGITNAQVSNAPPPAQALRDFARYAGHGATLVAHNGRRFDTCFITAASRRHNIAERTLPCIDTMEISKRLWFSGQHNLDTMARRLSVNPPTQHQRHDARADVIILANCFQHMLQKLTQGIAPHVTHKVTLPEAPPAPH
jgi:DNA polymerase III epsilon subunit family exonuclease